MSASQAATKHDTALAALEDVSATALATMHFKRHGTALCLCSTPPQSQRPHCRSVRCLTVPHCRQHHVWAGASRGRSQDVNQINSIPGEMDAGEPPVAAVLVGFILVSACSTGMHVCCICLETALEAAAHQFLSICPPEGSSLEVMPASGYSQKSIMRSLDIQSNLCDVPDTKFFEGSAGCCQCPCNGQGKEEQRTSGSQAAQELQ